MRRITLSTFAFFLSVAGWCQGLTPNGPSLTTPANLTYLNNVECEVANQNGPSRPWLLRYGATTNLELRVGGDLCSGQGVYGVHLGKTLGNWTIGSVVQQGSGTSQALILASLDLKNIALDFNTGYSWVGGKRCSFTSAAFSEQLGAWNLGTELVRQIDPDSVEHWQPMVYASYQIRETVILNIGFQRDFSRQGSTWTVICGVTFKVL